MLFRAGVSISRLLSGDINVQRERGVMRIAFLPSFRIAAGFLLVVLLGVVGCQVLHWRNPVSPEALLARADEMSWLNNWIAAEPLYRQAEIQLTEKHQL